MKARLSSQFTNKQRTMMKNEINRQILKQERHYQMDSDAMILYILHLCFGMGRERLMRFWRMSIEEHKRIKEFYEMQEYEDWKWVYRIKLKEETGIDIEELYKEHDKEAADDKQNGS